MTRKAKATTVKPVSVAKPVETKAAPVAEVKAAAEVKPVVETKAVAETKPVAETKAAEPKKTVAKKATAEKKPAAKKTTTKTATKKVELKSALHIQYAGKNYAEEDLLKIAKDVWRYDLKQKVGDLKSCELYVKPEENAVYYVMNEEFTGSFFI